MRALASERCAMAGAKAGPAHAGPLVINGNLVLDSRHCIPLDGLTRADDLSTPSRTDSPSPNIAGVSWPLASYQAPLFVITASPRVWFMAHGACQCVGKAREG